MLRANIRPRLFAIEAILVATFAVAIVLVVNSDFVVQSDTGGEELWLFVFPAIAFFSAMAVRGWAAPAFPLGVWLLPQIASPDYIYEPAFFVFASFTAITSAMGWLLGRKLRNRHAQHRKEESSPVDAAKGSR